MSARSLNFTVLSGEKVEPSVWGEVSALFSTEYGCYSAAAPERAGERIRLGVGYYERSYANADYRVALCRDGERLVAEAIYFETLTSRGRIALVVQLVVAGAYRKQGVASTLLHAVWGFSDYYAWGIVSSNAFTIETLEAATFRKTRPEALKAAAEWLRSEVLSRLPFLAAADWRLGDDVSVVNSRFFTARETTSSQDSDVAERLGRLAEGEEWLAVVLREQEPDDLSAYRSLVEASADLVRDAYRRMPQGEQRRASRTADEVDRILAEFPDLEQNARIVDFGAGTGRHVGEFRRRGFARSQGIDFIADGSSDLVTNADCRTWRSPEPVDLALCLYDVIGSFPDDAENERLIVNVAQNLKAGGAAVFSVSNWDFLDLRACRQIDYSEEGAFLRELFALRPSETMWTDGEFFDSNCVLVDPVRRIVCHKEKFPAAQGMLPGEYLIRDRRFTAEEIERWLASAGFDVLKTCFVRAGFKVDEAVSTGKEILLFARKVGTK